MPSSTVDETASAIQKRQRSRGITIVCSQRKIGFVIHVDPYETKCQTKRSKRAAKNFEKCEFHQDTWNCYLMLGFASAHNPWNAICNPELRRSFRALRNDLVLPSATTLSNIGRRDYPLTADAIEKVLSSLDEVSSALDGWTSPNKLATTLVIAYYMDGNRALREVQLPFNKVDPLCFCCFES